MSDNDLSHLRDVMKSATPRPDPAARAANLRLAEENFARLQGSLAEPRPTSDRPKNRAGLTRGVIAMLSTLTSRGALTATTSIAAIGLGLFIFLPQLDGNNDFAPPEPRRDLAETAQNRKTLPLPAEDEIVAPQVLADVASAPNATTRQERSLMASEAPATSLGRIAPAPMLLEKPVLLPETDSETFSNAPSNPVKITRNTPVSTFSIDVDTASYSIIRSSLMRGQVPPVAAVRIEEMINYFPYDYPAPTGDAPFATTATVLETPWNPATQLLHIAIQGALPAIDDRPPLNLVFLIDTSGSMQAPGKLPLLKQSFRLMLSQLRPEDEVAIVAYAGNAGEVLAPTKATDRTTILAALERLQSGGSTAGQAGLQQAYATAQTMAKDGEINRVILATDGDFNIGISDPQALETFIAQKRDSGTYLSVLGFGRGNLDDATMQALAQNGNGTAAYIDTLSEAQKVLVDQLSGALFTIAQDVKIQVEFNPARVAEYRLIGYETRTLNREDFNNDKVDAGEIGAGHSLTAIYEITPVGSGAILNDDLRYGMAEPSASSQSDELAFLRLRYKTPGTEASELIEIPIREGSDVVTSDISFSTAIAGFGQILRGSDYIGNWGYKEAIALANGAKGDDPFGYRTQAIALMRLAQSLSDQ